MCSKVIKLRMTSMRVFMSFITKCEHLNWQGLISWHNTNIGVLDTLLFLQLFRASQPTDWDCVCLLWLEPSSWVQSFILGLLYDLNVDNTEKKKPRKEKKPSIGNSTLERTWLSEDNLNLRQNLKKKSWKVTLRNNKLAEKQLGVEKYKQFRPGESNAADEA